MSDKPRVLIVDDHQEIRTVLRASLETLDLDLELIDVSSGEEAIVEVVGNGLDLLIADIGLPGLSGIEVIKKLKATYGEMQVLVITGLEDESVRQEIQDLEPDGFFPKPLQMHDFLNAVREIFGLDPIPEESDEDLQRLTKKILHPDVTDRIADLRGELGAISILLVEKSGLIAGETGTIPDAVYQTHILPLLLKNFQVTNQISSHLKQPIPKSVWHFSGEKYDLVFSHLNRDYGLVIITNPVTQKNDLIWVLTTVDLALPEVSEIINGLEKPAGKSAGKKQAKSPASKKTSSSKSRSAAKAKLPDQADKPSNGAASKSKKASAGKKGESEPAEDPPESENEVHEFWKAATLEEEITRIDSPDSLSFEQAQKLGFIPGSDEPAGD